MERKKDEKAPRKDGPIERGKKGSKEMASGVANSTGGSRQGNIGHFGNVNKDSTHR